MNTTLQSGVLSPTEPSGTYDGIPQAVFDVTSVYLGLLTFFGIFNNGLVLVLYTRYKTLRNPVNLFLINISVGDLSVSVLGSPFTFAANVARRWIFSAGGCTWYAFIVTVCDSRRCIVEEENKLEGTEQIVSLAAVSVHRCCLVVRPFTAQKMTLRWALIFISMTWAYSLIVSLPPAMGWNSYVLEGTGTACSVDWTSSDPGDSSYIIFIFVMVLVIPLSLIVGSYTLLLYAVKKIASSEAARSSQHKADKKVTIMVVVMITCFLVAWTPYSAFSLYVTASKDNTISPVAASVPAMFAKACTVYNPIIYFLLNQQFKDALIDMMCCGRNPFANDDNQDNTPRTQAARREASRTGGVTGATVRRGRQEISASMDTQMSEVGVTPAMQRRHIKIADWGAKGSMEDQPGEEKKEEGAATAGVTETPVEAFRVDEKASDELPAKKEVVKKHSRGFHKSSKICPVEQPDVEEV
ncbi:pinopsin-like [Acanthaster planci]|uniref:Pinopsin-like n=1 Tax=Acanthaster planci TaxID=133434 RepID=A0A8B7YUJ8_ACAPL|nr:pinopsin-like [Acanthaster planci]